MRLPRTPNPVALAPGVWRIPLLPGHGINAYAFREPDGGITLVDTGLTWTSSVLLDGLRAIGAGPGLLRRIVLTHAHPDHAGGAARLVELAGAAAVTGPAAGRESERATGPEVVAHERDVDYLRRGVPPMGDLATRAGRMAQRMPWSRYPKIGSVAAFGPDTVLPVAGGLVVHHTPGHTPGHVSLLHPGTGVLLTGDALFNVRGVGWPMRSFCTDPALNRRSADILGDLDYDIVAFMHGPEISHGAREAVRAFLRGRVRERPTTTPPAP